METLQDLAGPKELIDCVMHILYGSSQLTLQQPHEF